MKKILILKSDKDDFERYFIKKMNNTEIDCFPIYKKRNKCEKTSKIFKNI